MEEQINYFQDVHLAICKLFLKMKTNIDKIGIKHTNSKNISLTTLLQNHNTLNIVSQMNLLFELYESLIDPNNKSNEIIKL